jgi:hypothetical protein
MLPRLKSDLRTLFSGREGQDYFNPANPANRNNADRFVTLDVTHVESTLTSDGNVPQDSAVETSNEDGGAEMTVGRMEDISPKSDPPFVTQEPPIPIEEASGSAALDLTSPTSPFDGEDM